MGQQAAQGHRFTSPHSRPARVAAAAHVQSTLLLAPRVGHGGAGFEGGEGGGGACDREGGRGAEIGDGGEGRERGREGGRA